MVNPLYSVHRTKKKLPFLYLSIIPASTLIILLYPRHNLLSNLELWYLFPAWILGSHILCGFSYLITGFSIKHALYLIKYSFYIYSRKGSFIHLQAAFLISLVEECIFRYFLLFFITDLLHNSIGALILSSILFSFFHFVFNQRSKKLLRYLDLFIFSFIAGMVTLFTNSFYPALLIHGMRNYILRILLVYKNKKTPL